MEGIHLVKRIPNPVDVVGGDVGIAEILDERHHLGLIQLAVAVAVGLLELCFPFQLYWRTAAPRSCPARRRAAPGCVPHAAERRERGRRANTCASAA